MGCEDEVIVPEVGDLLLEARFAVNERLGLGKQGHQIDRRKQHGRRQVDADVGRVRADGLELIGEAAPAAADLQRHAAVLAAEPRQHPGLVQADQHLVELQGVQVGEAVAHLEAEAAQLARLGHEQALAVGGLQDPVLADVVVLLVGVVLAVVVRLDAGDVVALLAQGADHQGRGVEHVEEALDLLAPVGAGTSGGVQPRPVVHHHADGVAHLQIVGVGGTDLQRLHARGDFRLEVRRHRKLRTNGGALGGRHGAHMSKFGLRSSICC